MLFGRTANYQSPFTNYKTMKLSNYQTKVIPRLSFAPVNVAPRGDTLVVIFLRGAADVLNMVVPHGEEAYYQLRPTLGVARPDDSRKKRDERVVDLDGFFGLHPFIEPARAIWERVIASASGAWAV